MVAEERAERMRLRPRSRKLEANQRLYDFVQYGLSHEWSPEQISGKLVEQYPDDLDMRVSAETIYQTLFLQARGELRTQLKLALRTGRTRQISPSRAAETRGKIQNMVTISDRPAEAEDRAVPGFWVWRGGWTADVSDERVVRGRVAAAANVLAAPTVTPRRLAVVRMSCTGEWLCLWVDRVAAGAPDLVRGCDLAGGVWIVGSVRGVGTLPPTFVRDDVDGGERGWFDFVCGAAGGDRAQ